MEWELLQEWAVSILLAIGCFALVAYGVEGIELFSLTQTQLLVIAIVCMSVGIPGMLALQRD